MISVHEAEKLSLKGIAAFLHASEEIHFLGENRPQVYAWMETVLRQQQYVQQGRRARGLLRRYRATLAFTSSSRNHLRTMGVIRPGREALVSAPPASLAGCRLWK